MGRLILKFLSMQTASRPRQVISQQSQLLPASEQECPTALQSALNFGGDRAPHSRKVDAGFSVLVLIDSERNCYLEDLS